MTSPAPRIGLIGTFDVENYGDVLLSRIARRELEARLPEAEIRTLSPVGYAGLNRFDDGSDLESLDPWSEERVAELADGIDLAVVGGGEIIHDHDELLGPHYGLEPEEMRTRAPSRFFIDGLGPDVALAWHSVGIPWEIGPEQYARYRESLAGAYVAVRDEASRRRLRATGVDIDIELVPDSGFLLDRLFPDDLLARRCEYLRRIEVMPEDEPLVVQGNRDLVPAVAEIATQARTVADGSPIVCVETGPCHGDAEFTRAFAQAYPGRVWAPGAYAGLADLTAIIAASRGVIGSSFHGNLVAFVYGKPSVILGMDGRSKLAGLAETMEQSRRMARSLDQIPQALWSAPSGEETLGALQKRVDEHFDRLAEFAIEAAWRRNAGATSFAGVELVDPVEGELEQLRTAMGVRGRRLIDERLHLADEMQELRAQLAINQERIEDLEGQVAGARQELADLRSTAVVRYTKGLRAVYSAVFMPLKLWIQRRRGSR